MGGWLKGALTPPKWVRDATGLSTNSLLNIVSPSGFLSKTRDTVSDLVDKQNSGSRPQATVVSQGDKDQTMLLVGGAAALYLIFN